MKCKDLATALVCFTNAGGVKTQLVAHYEYGKNATGGTIIVATRYTTPDGVAFNTSTGTVVAGACVADTLAANPVHWAGTSNGFSFANFPNLGADFSGTTNVSDLFLHAIEFGGTVYSMTGSAFTGTEPDLPWASSQSGVNAVLAALSLPANSITVATDTATNQPVVFFSAPLVAADFAFWAGPTGPGGYTNKLPAATPFTGVTSPSGSAGCVEGKAWYSAATGALVRVNTLDGADVTGTVAASSLAEGPCPAAATVPADVEFLELCDVSGAGVTTEFVRRVVTTFSATGAPTTTLTDLAADLVTPYTPTGTVGECNKDCAPATAQGVLATWG